MKALECIYIAGKMHNDAWRWKLFDGKIASSQWGDHPFTVEAERSDWPDSSKKTVCGLRYTGPFFVDTMGGHGYSYDPARLHGGNITNSREIETGFQLIKVQRECLDAIARADLLLAWIDAIDCYGTIAEIGYAKALGKIVWIAGPFPYHDFWFIYRMADRLMFQCYSSQDLKSWLSDHQYYYQSFTSPIEAAFWDAWTTTLLEFESSSVDSKGLRLVPQYQIGRYRVDFAHESTKTAIELDGHATHSSPDAIAYDRKRQRELEQSGWHVIRFGGKEVYTDARVCAIESLELINKKIYQKRKEWQQEQLAAGVE